MLMGPPGSGKGTQAVRIAQRYSIPHISTGDALRAAVKAGTRIGREVKETIDAGRLVSDDLIADIVRERLAAPDTARGCILDGFPRTAAQAATLDTMVDPAMLIVAHLAAADEEIVRRLAMRRVCDACAITQSVSHDPDTVRRRLETYRALAEPLVAFYERRPTFGTIDGLQALDRVTAALCAHIDRCRR